MRPHVRFAACASLVALVIAALAGGCSGEVLPVGIEALEGPDGATPVDSAASSDGAFQRDAARTDTTERDSSPDTKDMDDSSDSRAGDATADTAEEQVGADSGSQDTGAGGEDSSLGDASTTGDSSTLDSGLADAAKDAIGSDTQPDGPPGDGAPADGDAGQTYTIGGTISGLAAQDSVELSDGSRSIFFAANGTFAFPPVPDGTAYTVTVSSNPGTPISQTCIVAMGTGTVAGANVTNITVSCTTDVFTVGGTVTGLTSVQSVELLDNGTNALTFTGSGNFTFTTPLPSGSTYDVTVGPATVAPGVVCAVSAGTASGTITSQNVTNVAVQCGPSVGGTVVGLPEGASMVLQVDGQTGPPLLGNALGTQTFTFPTPLTTGQSYNVTVLTPPSGETCTVHNGSGTTPAAGVTNVQVLCGYLITVTVTGLTNAPSSFTLSDGTGTYSTTVTVTANGMYMFSGPVPPPNATYNIMAAPGTICTAMAPGQISGPLTGNLALTLVCN